MAKTRKTSPAATTPAARRPLAPNPINMAQTSQAKANGIEKTFLENRPVCKVTFTMPRAAAPGAERVCLLGEFNNWSRDATPMTRQQNHDFSVSLELAKGRSYRFRYLIDGTKFENDWAADRYTPNPYGGEDSVVDL